jgi:chromosome segregation ATPase
MYSAAESELGEEIAAVREDPSSAPQNVAALAALMNEWDQIEQTVRELFQHALNQTLMIARLREKAIQVQAGLTDTDLQIQEVQRTRDEVFSEIKRRAQERPSFLSSGTEAPLSYGSQDPGKAGQDETLSLPPGPGARRTAVGRGNLEEAAEKASAAEEAVRRASGAVEEAKRNVGAMGKNYEKCRDSADKMRRNYNRARSGNRDDADQLRSESRSADRMAEQALEDLRAAERKAESAAENLDSARREAARARDEYNTLKDASEKA